MSIAANPMKYYAQHGPMTDMSSYPEYMEGLPAGLSQDIPGFVKLVQNIMLHVFWAEHYGVQLSDEQKASLNVRGMDGKLALLKAAGIASLHEPLAPAQRQVGNCRDFSLFLTALLRARGIPARARCGFGTYFLPDHYEDHWVIEYWDRDRSRWVMVDPQIDEMMAAALKLDFDPLDMPSGKFVVAGQAWQMARRGEADPEAFGIFDMHGLWFIAGNVVRDILALNKIEILPWDHGWGLLADDESQGRQPGAGESCIDQIAALILPGQEDFEGMRAFYENEPGLHPPQEYFETGR
jgi:hypothetical protein